MGGVARRVRASRSGALAWGAAAGWDDRAFRVYYLFGGLLTAALLGAGSLLRVGRAWVGPVALVYVGARGRVALADAAHGPGRGRVDPRGAGRISTSSRRGLLAIVGNSLGHARRRRRRGRRACGAARSGTR